jgi:hypothetical protein
VLGGDRRGADGVQVLGHLVAWPYVRGGESCSKMEREKGSRVGHARKASAGLHLSKNIQPKVYCINTCIDVQSVERERATRCTCKMHGRPFF